MEAYGFANRCLSEITAEMMGNEDLLKFLYYTDNEEEDFLAKEKPTADKIINKHIYTGRRIPDILHRSGAYICTRMNEYAPVQRKSEIMKLVEIELMIIVHDKCANTIYGSRDVAILSALEEALDEKNISGVGKCILTRGADIQGLPIEYSGYFAYVEVQGFPTLKVGR